jgi:excisionase family DNA binding protein
MKARDVRQNDRFLKTAGESRAAARSQTGQPLRFYTKAEVADMLGVSLRSVQRWIDSHGLVAHRLGAAVRISELDLRAFLPLHRDG